MKKRIFSFLLVAILLVTALPLNLISALAVGSDIVASGEPSVGLIPTLDSEGSLTVSGEGETYRGANGISSYADDLRYGWRVLEQMENSEALLFAYEQIAKGFSSAEESISVYDAAHYITPEELVTVMTVIMSDFPEFFWNGSGYSYSYNVDINAALDVFINYSVSGDELSDAKAALEAEAEKLLAALEGKTDYEKSLIIHDRLAERVTYEFTSNDQNAYGALVEGKAVCSGYASAYQYLLHKAGIPAWKVTGSSINPSTGTPEGHAWNIVCIDGEWYHTDTTWADQGEDIYYAYFNVTTAAIKEDHVMDALYETYAPECTSDDANYFVVNGGKVEKLDIDSVAADLRDDMAIDYYITGDMSAFLNDFRSNILEIAQKAGITESFSYSLYRLGRELRIKIEIIHDCIFNQKVINKKYLKSEGNCFAPAVYYKSCACGKFGESTFEGEMDRTNHVGDTEIRNYNEPSCEQDGYTGDTYCMSCETKLNEGLVLPETGHFYTDEVTEPTCTEQGCTKHTCTECGNSYIDNYTEKTAHAYGDWYETLAPACTENGEERRDCNGCNNYETRIINKLGHFEVIDEATEAACEESGLSEGSHCSRCGEILVAQIYIEPLGHDWDEGVVSVEPTEETDGEMLYTCKSCYTEIVGIIPALGHRHDYTPTVTEPTCTEQGYTTYVCRCDESYVADFVDAAGHEMSEWSQIKAPDCLEAGEKYRECGNCDYNENDIVQALGHDVVYHDAVAPTCTEIGWDAYETCARCDHTTYSELVATGHGYEAVVTEPTCTEAGYTVYVCHCGDNYADGYTDAFGHSEGEWITITEPEIGKEGVKELRCTECGEVLFTETIPALESETILGDPNGDGDVDKYDYILIKRFCMGTFTLEGIALDVADVNGDGEVDKYDYILIKRHCMGTYDLFA